jgi:hypothetical protein
MATIAVHDHGTAVRSTRSTLETVMLALLGVITVIWTVFQIVEIKALFPPIGILYAAGSIILIGLLVRVHKPWMPAVVAAWAVLTMIPESLPAIEHLLDWSELYTHFGLLPACIPPRGRWYCHHRPEPRVSGNRRSVLAASRGDRRVRLYRHCEHRYDRPLRPRNSIKGATTQHSSLRPGGLLSSAGHRDVYCALVPKASNADHHRCAHHRQEPDDRL